MAEAVHLDGAMGEGGGQVLRSALTMSMLTGQPFEIENIRANRNPAGLRPQHLECVKAAAKISSADVEGDRLASRKLEFAPRQPLAGGYEFPIPTAGSAALVLHTIYLPLALRTQTSEIRIGGGTHVPFAPCFDFLQDAWAPAMARLGIGIDLELVKTGFYPPGGGSLVANVHPVAADKPGSTFAWTQRGSVRGVTPVSITCRLPESIRQRQADRAVERLKAGPAAPLLKDPVMIERESASPGTMLGIRVDYEFCQAFFFSLGEMGKPAEKVADEACDELEAFLPGSAPIDPYLADQLVLPMAAGLGPMHFTTTQTTKHLETNVEVVNLFAGRKVRLKGKLGGPAEVATESR